MEIINTSQSISNIPTSDFTLGKFNFTEFNYLQTLFYPYKDQDNNVVISAATSAGKTVCGELAAAHTLETGKKVIYLAPLKALSEEKINTWTDSSHFLSSKKIEIVTGDHKLTESKIKKVQEADIIIMTSEMLDTRTRYINSPSNSWLNDVGLVIVDEAHLLTTERGPALEVGLMRFTKINQNARIILLSATMTNYQQIGEWVEHLNNKPTKILSTTWRPVELFHHKINSRTSRIDIEQTLNVLTGKSSNVPLHLVDDNSDVRMCAEIRMKGGIDNIKTLLFVHTKNVGRKLEEQLTKRGYKAEFHNADLGKLERNKLEKRFKDDLDILISTSTLAWGINLPARHVIILGEMRGMETVSNIDLVQMCGRAGRFGMYDRGDVFLFDCDIQDQFKINSNLGRYLPFHIVAEISNQTFNDVNGAINWLKRSFLYCSTMKIANGDIKASNYIKDCFINLVKWQAIKQDENNIYSVTKLGKVARDLYLDPEDIYNWKCNLKKVEEINGWDKESLLAWMVGNGIKLVHLDYIPQPLRFLNQNFKRACALKTTNEAIISVLYYRLCRDQYDSYQIKQLDQITNLYLQLILRDSGRIFGALKRISQLYNLDREQEIEVAKARIIHGVGKQLIELVSIPGIGGVIATQLYKAGIKTLKDVKDNRDKLSQIIERKANVTRILNGLKELEDQEIDEIDF